MRFRGIRANEGLIRNKIFADTNESEYLLAGPQDSLLSSSITVILLHENKNKTWNVVESRRNPLKMLSK